VRQEANSELGPTVSRHCSKCRDAGGPAFKAVSPLARGDSTACVETGQIREEFTEAVKRHRRAPADPFCVEVGYPMSRPTS
jgi:hypothetical protein